MNKSGTYSVSKTARLIGLSRPRFYELLNKGVFPRPHRNPSNNRPYYDQNLYEKCRQIKATGIDIKGRRVIFYKPRQKQTKKESSSKDLPLKEIYDILTQMGINCSKKDFINITKTTYPNGFKKLDKGVVIRELYRQLCKRTV
jgi:DNA-binding transcriptional MerR regulator